MRGWVMKAESGVRNVLLLCLVGGALIGTPHHASAATEEALYLKKVAETDPLYAAMLAIEPGLCSMPAADTPTTLSFDAHHSPAGDDDSDVSPPYAAYGAPPHYDAPPTATLLGLEFPDGFDITESKNRKIFIQTILIWIIAHSFAQPHSLLFHNVAECITRTPGCLQEIMSFIDSTQIGHSLMAIEPHRLLKDQEIIVGLAIGCHKGSEPGATEWQNLLETIRTLCFPS